MVDVFVIYFFPLSMALSLWGGVWVCVCVYGREKENYYFSIEKPV